MLAESILCLPLVPRAFMLDMMHGFKKEIKILPAIEDGTAFAVVSTSPLGIPEGLPPGFLVRQGETYFAIITAPAGTTVAQLREELAVAAFGLKFGYLVEEKDQEDLRQDFKSWREAAEEAEAYEEEYQRRRTEEERDLDFVFGNAHTPPAAHNYETTEGIVTRHVRDWEPQGSGAIVRQMAAPVPSAIARQLSAPAPECCEVRLQEMQEEDWLFG